MDRPQFVKINNIYYNIKYIKEIMYNDGFYEITIVNTESGGNDKYGRSILRDKTIFCREQDFNLCSLSKLFPS